MQVYTCIVSICKRIVKRVYLSTLRRLIIKLVFIEVLKVSCLHPRVLLRFPPHRKAVKT